MVYRTLVSIGMDTYHSVAVYQWMTKDTSTWATQIPQLIHAERTSNYKTLACFGATNSLFITCGERHIYFWQRDSEYNTSGETAVFTKRSGCLGKKAKMQTLLCLNSISENVVISGSVRGEIWLWEGRNCIKVIHAHTSSVNVLHVFPGGVISGSKDGKIRIWSKRMEPGAQFDIMGKFCMQCSPIVSDIRNFSLRKLFCKDSKCVYECRCDQIAIKYKWCRNIRSIN